jgi:hypothetical protein
MPIAEFRLPDGRIAQFKVPDGTTPEQAQQMIAPLLSSLPQPKPEPGILSQLAGLPKEVGKGFIRGLTVDPVSGLTSLGYTGARAAGAELAPFEKTEFGQALGRAQTALAPSDAGMITQFGGGLGSLLSFIPGGVLKGGVGLATRLTQAGAVGSEEARSRAEQAALEGKAVSPGQQFQSQLMGTGVGFTELLPVEKLADPLKAVLRGIPVSEANKIAPGLFNSAKRMLATGGIEGLQEGMANIAQDLIQKGVYDPNLDIGKSALGDAAMGASVGAFAQGAIEFMTRGKRGQMYQQLKTEERQKEFNDKMAAMEAANQKQIADTQQKLGVPDPTILALPAPAPKIEAVPERDPLMNPVGFFNANEINPDDLNVINKARKGEGKRTLSQFSIEDLADSGAPQAEIDRLLAYKTGYDGSVKLGAENVLNAAAERNVDTTTVGFRDFLRRSTGSEDLSTMSQPQLHSAFTALSALEPSQEVQVLPPGTNAIRFSDDQYSKSLDKLNTTFPEDNVMPRDRAIDLIKKSSGLKTDRDAESLLQSAIRSGDLNTVGRTVFELGIPGDPTSPAARVYTNRESAERSARKLGLEVREAVHQDIAPPSEFKALPGGPDIRQGTFKQGMEPAGYEIRSPDGKTWLMPTQDEADAKVDRLQTLRTQMANGFLGEAAKTEKRMEDNQRKLDKMEAEGRDNTLEYKKLSADIAAQNKQLSNRVDQLKAKAKVFSAPLEIAPKGEKPVTREGFTLFEQGQPVAIFPTQQAAEEAALIRLPDDTLQTIVNLAPSQKGLMPKRLGKMAEVELQRRRGEQPAGFGVAFKGDRAEAEARLAEAGVFTPEFQKAADELTKKLRPMMERLGLGDLRLNILRSIKTGDGQTADGYYTQRLIAIALDAPNPMRTLRHEGIHALKELGAFTPQQWKVLEDRARSEWMGKYDIANRYKDMGLSQNELLEEAISDAFSDFDQTKAPPGLIGALFNKIRRFFEAFGNGLRGMGFQTAESVFETAEAGGLQPISQAEVTGAPKYALAQQTEKFEDTADITPLTIQNARIYERELEALIKKIGSRIAGMKSEETLSDVRKAVEKLQSYTAQGLKGKDWYENSAKAVLDAFNGDPVLAEKFFQIIAITSANTEVAANFTKTMNAWQQFADGKPIEVGTGNENRKIDALLNFGEDWEGRKTNTFYTNLIEAMEGKDSGRSTIDLHMTRMLFDKDQPTDAQYELAENMVRLLASKVGIPARQVQAASWVTQKAKSLFDNYRAKGKKKNLSDTELRELAFERALADYSHLMKAKIKTLRVTDAMRELSSSIRARVQNITGEVIPSVETEMSQVAEMNFKNKEDLTKEVIKQNLVQKIAEDLGITSKIRVTMGSGAYSSKINPNLIVQLVNDDPTVAQQESLELANAMSYVFKQDATPVFRADPALIQSDQLGYRFKFDTKTLTPSQQKKILAILTDKLANEETKHLVGFTRTRGNEIVIINFRGKDGQPFLTTDEAFQDGLAEVRDDINKIAKITAQEMFGAQSEYPYHDWSQDTGGAGLIEGLYAGRPQRPDLQKRLDGIRDFFVGQARQSVERSGVTPRFALRPDEFAGRSGIGSGVSIREQQPDAQSFDGVHYGKRRVNSLAGSMYGTGIKGAEAQRVFSSPDSRIKNRAYFYIPLENGRMPMPESGLGNEVHIQRLNNILGPGEKLQSLVNATRSPNGQVDANALESAVIDAGYDGYAVPKMGMMVVLNADVPVIPRGTRQEVEATPDEDKVQIGDRKYALRQTDTPEFKQFFGNSKIVSKGYTGMLSGEDVMNSMGIPESEHAAYWGNLSREERDKLMRDFRSRGKGKPLVMYHGTARDITEFRAKQANAIFLTEDPNFAEGFSGMSEDYMVREYINNATPQETSEIVEQAIKKGLAEKDITQSGADVLRKMDLRSASRTAGVGDYVIELVKSRLPSGQNIMPVFVRAENPFDYANPDHVEALAKQHGGLNEFIRDEISRGAWETIEAGAIQKSIRAAGFDGFYVLEGGRKNLAVYEPSQIKSAIGNIGTFARDNNDIRYALALQGLKPDSALVPNEGGNKEGNLGISPERLGGKPIRMLIGTHNDIDDKGYGANHILNRVLNDPKRIPGGAEDLLEKIVRTAQRTAQNYTSIYRDGGKFVLYDGKNSLVVSPEKRDMSIITMFVQDNPQRRYGAPVWVGRAPRMAEFLEPVRGVEVSEREGRVARKEVPVQTKRVYTPEEIARIEESPVETPRKAGTLSIKRDAFRASLRDSMGQDMVDAIERTTTKREEKGFTQRMGEAISPTGFAKFRQAMINKYEAIERLSKDVAEQFGSKELLADTSAISAALFSDRAAGVAASSYLNGIPIYRKGFTSVSDMDGSVKGLIPILEPLAKYNDPFVFQAFQYYAATRRGKRLDAEGREKLFTPQDIKRGELLGKQYPEFKQVFDEYQKYNKGLVEFMRDTGVISEKEAEIWTQNWDYIPFYRQLEGEETAGPNVFSPIAGVSKPKKLKGGEAPLADFMETVVRNSRAAIEAGMKNVAAQRVMRDMLRLNQGELVPAALARGSDIVTVKENGLTKHYRVDDPLLVEALKSLNMPQLPFLEVLAMPSNILRNLVTKDPGFMLANLMRDSLQAWVTTGTNIIPIVDTFKQYGAALAGKSKEAQALAKAGLFAGYDFASDVKSSASEVEAELRKRAGQRTAGEIAMLPLSKIWDMLDKGSSVSDVATRAEVYKRTLEETGNEAEALYQAMEVLNFSRKGNSALIRVLTALVPFMNARIQGLDVLYRSGFGKSATQNKERMQKAFITRSLSILALSAMYWMLASDTEEYETAEQEVRDNYWIIGNVRIPIPFEIGTVFKVFPERILEYFFGEDTSKDLKDSIVRNITSTLAFNPIPQAFLPAVENIANYSFFTGQPIVGKGLEDVAAKYQASAGTSLLAQEVGGATGYSPVKIDNLIRGYTGTLGTYAVMLLDSVMRGEGDPTKATMRAEQLPVIKRFFASPDATGTVTAYYEMKKAVDESTRTINFLERTGNIKDLQEYMQDKGAKLQGIKPYIQTLDKDMTMLREMRRAIQISGMEPDQKRDVLDNIRKAEVALTSRIQYVKKSID